MADEHSRRRYLRWYGRLLRLYPRPYRERFAEGMAQTFNDRLREREGDGRGLFGSALWMFLETSAGIVRVSTRTARSSNIVRIVLVTAFILLIPLVAMQFTDEVAWTPGDFVFAGVLLLGTGLAYELIARRAGSRAYRRAVGVALATGFILIWITGAVGIIGSEDNPANLMYLGVLAVGIIGAVIARLRSRGMARAMFATAIAQASVPLIALFVGRPPVASMEDLVDVARVFVLSAFFAMLFAGSALLFRRAGATGSSRS